MTQIRSARDADVDAVLALWAVAAENDARPTDSAEMVRALLARDPDALLLAFDDEPAAVAAGADAGVDAATSAAAPIGSIIAGFDGWRYHLYRLAVLPERRRQGVGAALMRAAEERLRALGATRLDAMVLEGNELGSAAWTAAGFAPQPEWRRWVRLLD